MARGWKFKVPLGFDIKRAGDDLEEGKITIEEARDQIVEALKKAAGKFPLTPVGLKHAEMFRGFAEDIGYQDDLEEIDAYLSDLYDYADQERIWVDEERQGPLEWRPS